MTGIKLKSLLGLVGTAILVLTGCAAKKAPTQNNFGVSVNHPKFEGAGDFLKHYGKVNNIILFKRLNGGPVDMGWIDPAFREKLCLTLTINNHCVG